MPTNTLKFHWISARLVVSITAFLPSLSQVEMAENVILGAADVLCDRRQVDYPYLHLHTCSMSNAYLLKTEPSEYSFADLKKDKKTVWDGVHNPVALRNLGAMKAGDKLVIYETGDIKSAVGLASVAAVKDPNPKNPQVEIAAGKALAKPVSLAQIKANNIFASSPLVRMGRLSVVPLTADQYKALAGS